MLKTLDMLIGLATIMLLFSLPVTIISQAFMTLFNTRGRNLWAGVRDLLMQLDPSLDSRIAGVTARAVLKHPMVAGQWGSMGSVIHRSELTALLLEFAADAKAGNLDEATHAALKKAMATNGIKDPAAALSSIRDIAMQLEESSPELAAHVREAKAMIEGAKSHYIAKVNAWFDRMVDQVSDRFTFSARLFTLVAAFSVAGILQLDVVAIVNRLSIDDAFRKAVTENANAIVQQAGQAIQAGAGPTLSSTVLPSSAAAQNATGQAASPVPSATPVVVPVSPGVVNTEYYNLLATEGLIHLPFMDKECWWESWWHGWNWRIVPGLVLSTLMLSLGAPFWYSTLQNLLKLRSALADKDDEEREARQTRTSPS